MADIHVNMCAYCKIMLHVVKYPHCAVNGLLLADKTKNKDGKNVYIVDAIPLFHICLGLSPMMEIALTQVDHYCKSKGLVIAGYYQANEHYKDSVPDFFACRIADKISDNCNDACLLMISNRKLSLNCMDTPFQIYNSNDGKWKQKEKINVHLEQDGKTFAAASALLHAKEHRKLIDFDNHLDNVMLCWKNEHLNETISRLL